jgi:hypothetical protein
MAEEFYLEVRLVLVIPFALIKKENVAYSAPGVGPAVRFSGITRKPSLHRISHQMFADERLVSDSMRAAFKLV